MLVSLYVNNFAIIDNIRIDFKDKMSVLTGETGAGKSLIIDAIGLLFGKRASQDLIRFGETKATIEGVFNTFDPKICSVIGEEISEDEYLVIKREIYSNGKSLCKINNNIVSLAQLSEIAETIGDIHSQFDTQGLFNPKNYLEFIDDEETKALLKDYRAALEIYQKNNRHYQDLLNKNRDDTQRIEFLKFQLSELEKAALNPVEEEELKQRSHVLNNFGLFSDNLKNLLSLYDDNNILDRIYESLGYLQKITSGNEKLTQLRQQIEDAYYNLSDAVATINQEYKNLDFNPEELESINSRIGVYSDLHRKYKKTTAEIIDFQEHLKNEINNIENYDVLIADLEKSVKEAYDKTLMIGNNIREKRKNNSKILKSKITETLFDLQLKNTVFEVCFNPEIRFYQNGIDEVDFLISFNKGEPLKPLSKVASGGELSRFMLALKSLVSEKLHLQTIIFDEIDNGVSGAIAYSIANKIKGIAERSQVLCVTHIPQVAAISDHHFRISKKTEQNRTVTEIQELNYEERILEIAKMISNGEVTTASKNLAIELLKK